MESTDQMPQCGLPQLDVVSCIKVLLANIIQITDSIQLAAILVTTIDPADMLCSVLIPPVSQLHFAFTSKGAQYTFPSYT